MKLSKIKIDTAAIGCVHANAFVGRIINDFLKALSLTCIIAYTLSSCESNFSTPLDLQQTTSGQTPKREGDNYVRTLQWEYKDTKFQKKVSVPISYYEHYCSKPTSRLFTYYTLEDSGFHYIDTLCAQLYAPIAYKGYSESDVAQYLLEFVHAIEYGSDGDEELPKFPIQSLFDPSGADCEDLSLMYLVLLQKFGIRAALLNFPGHIAVGVNCLGCSGESYLVHNETFFYAETTSIGWNIGAIPDEYRDIQADISIIDIPEDAATFRPTNRLAPIYPEDIGIEPNHRSDYWYLLDDADEIDPNLEAVMND